MTTEGFNAEMLVIARRSRSMTQAELAKLAAVARPTLARYEIGSLPVSDDVLARLADSLDYPIRFFCRKPQLIGVSGGAVFHRKRQSLPTKALYHAHACAEVRRLEITTLLQSEMEEAPGLPEYPADLYGDDPARIARSVRDAMNIPPGPIFNLTETLERNGCIVVAHDFDSRHLDGFTQRPLYPPNFIHLNKALPPDRWRWTLAHELAHLIMHFEVMDSHRIAEEQANVFAAEFLTPAHEIAPEMAGLTFQKLSGLKLEWRVSMQALITRAYQLDIISARQRQTMFIRMANAGYRTREPATLDPPVEKPTTMTRLARRYCETLGYSPHELAEFLAINKADFVRHYSDDVWASIDDIVKDF